jgi:hypothetical protein
MTKQDRHTRTDAAKTTTKEEVELPLRGPSPQQIQAQQQADAERNRATPTMTAVPPAAPGWASAPPATVPAAPVVSSPEVLQQRAAAWGSTPLTLADFHGNDGIFRLVQDGTQIPDGSRFIAAWTETRKGFCNFSDDSYRQEMVGIGEDRAEVQREDLGDTDPEQWPVGMDGQKRDPWQPQYVLPLQRFGEGMELIGFVARNGVSIAAVEGLIGRCRFHPRARQGFFPLIQLGVGHYNNRRFGGVRPKPLLTICRLAAARWHPGSGRGIVGSPAETIRRDERRDTFLVF